MFSEASVLYENPEYRDYQQKNKIMKDEITITIAGPVKSGKSRIAYIVKEMMKIHGLRVNFDPSPDFIDEPTFNKAMRHDLNEALGAIMENTVVTVKEVQLARKHFKK